MTNEHERGVEAVAAKIRSPSTFPGETATQVARELIAAYIDAGGFVEKTTDRAEHWVGDIDSLASAFQGGFTNGNAAWNETPEHHKEMFREGVRSLLRDQQNGTHLDGEDTVALHSEGTPEGGVIRLSKWPEGYVLWYHGQIVWRSWANSNALLDVAAERRRQVGKEGWSHEHDDAHHDFSLAKAACIYAVGATLNAPDRAVMDSHGADGTPGWMKELWPWDIKWWKPTGRRRDMVKAAALIIAEIERLDRAKYLNAADGKIYEMISREGDMVAFKRKGRETPYYLCIEEFDKRFKLHVPPAAEEASPAALTTTPHHTTTRRRHP
ncbi:hypothetical protein [Rhizobium laguerreae]|uniref:hypothetical protein n=1 Tax=Rhizobium laguerreae TaxID=1076926 RepID=UPI001980D9AC|nr:hypothetical protein [Rhizobium laguerreae]